MKVIGAKGCGSVLAEAALILAGVSYTREEVDYEHPTPAFLALNPLGQVPTIVMDDGSIMTETAAFALWLDGEHPRAQLLPPVGDPLRAQALRWLVYLVAAIYPTFTYGDQPAKWVGDAAEALRVSTNAHRERCWMQVEGAAVGPWFLGDRLSMLDVYITAMTHWRPRRAWFQTNAPKLFAIATALDADPRLRPLWAASF
ncbi:MAG: glutathione S-transferase family protein [Myxococcota bacterium]|nr:glutathione S-transferase family protein [Deltaproteobacteria bacterium]MDQ3337121.1 glutathione S-transferase family protein [Myxococcota bacterium]